MEKKRFLDEDGVSELASLLMQKLSDLKGKIEGVMSTHKLKSIKNQRDDVYWFLYRDGNGLKRIVFCSDENGSGAGSHGNGAVLNAPPFVTRSVSRSISVSAGTYTSVNVNPPSVPGYTYLGVVGMTQGINSKLNVYSLAPTYVGFHNWNSGPVSGNITFTLLYGRNGS